MIRFLFRFLGLLCLALGFIFLVYDGTKTIADQKWPPYITRVSDVWAAVHESSLTQLKPTLERFAGWLWDPVAVFLLNAPGFAVLLIVGVLLMVVGRRKRKLIGYARD